MNPLGEFAPATAKLEDFSFAEFGGDSQPPVFRDFGGIGPVTFANGYYDPFERLFRNYYGSAVRFQHFAESVDAEAPDPGIILTGLFVRLDNKQTAASFQESPGLLEYLVSLFMIKALQNLHQYDTAKCLWANLLYETYIRERNPFIVAVRDKFEGLVVLSEHYGVVACPVLNKPA
jgi:hypothetical protein